MCAAEQALGGWRGVFSFLVFGLRWRVLARFFVEKRFFWGNWAVKESTLDIRKDKRQHGLFASKRFEKGKALGTHMGEVKEVGKDAENHEHILKHKSITEKTLLVIDAGGGIDSGFPAYLGMHHINDPTFGLEDGALSMREAKKKINVEFRSDGHVCVTKRILKNEEMFVNYQWSHKGVAHNKQQAVHK